MRRGVLVIVEEWVVVKEGQEEVAILTRFVALYGVGTTYYTYKQTYLHTYHSYILYIPYIFTYYTQYTFILLIYQFSNK